MPISLYAVHHLTFNETFQKIKKLLFLWSRAIRIKFLLASAIAVTNGIAISYWEIGYVDLAYALLTYFGIMCLHISVDLLNDYSDFKRGIDTNTKRTKYSGGTGVIPENLINSRLIYSAGIIFLILGGLTGLYFVTIKGIIILILLIFAIISIYFYSTNIVNAGLGELFVAIKGCMIVLGSYYIQSDTIGITSIYVGIIIGLLSAVVLLVTSFPDYEADKKSGRRTLIIVMGKENSVKLFIMIVGITYAMIIGGSIFNIMPIFSTIGLLSMPFAIKAAHKLRRFNDASELVSSMANSVIYSRVCGILLAISFFI
ncbi:MAG TPA: prenyltransferase [Nitrososphaeraceae archaeon]|nr:prenyltransferase [Nitrososphaeraceae archaeon]